jgi:hypothetical protein
MKREERNEFNYIKRSLKGFTLGYGTTLTIRTDAGSEYKHALDELYTSLNFHPASVRVDSHMYDEKERIIYIYSRTWEDNDGNAHPWTELYTPEERARFEAALG